MPAKTSFQRLTAVMARLRGPGGCPWDHEQTHKSLLRYLREETKEVEQAVRKNDMDNLREELGDLLLQVVFHAQIAKDNGDFTINDVVKDLCKKLVRRHPHVFGKTKLKTAQEVSDQWNELKRREKALAQKDRKSSRAARSKQSKGRTRAR